MIRRYRRRPRPVEAVQYTGDNAAEILAWAPESVAIDTDDCGLLQVESRYSLRLAGPGDWIFRDEAGWLDVDGGSWFAEAYELEGGGEHA